jgi:hypothetical protein
MALLGFVRYDTTRTVAEEAEEGKEKGKALRECQVVLLGLRKALKLAKSLQTVKGFKKRT